MSTALPNIHNVIVLMFENRSFDHFLGAMLGVDGVLEGNNVKPGLYNTMDPLQQAGSSNKAVPPTPIVPGTSPDPRRPPNYEAQFIIHDFNHDFGDGMTQDLFGPGTTGIIGGQPQNNPVPTYPSTNSGFLSTLQQPHTPNGPGAMTYFEWQSMKVFHALATSFLVCDAWHCDMPGHTSPNRAFMHCATTGDLGINDDDTVGSTNMVNRLTIFERIQERGQTWKMYSANNHCDTNWLNEQVLRRHYDPANPNASNVTNVPITKFFTDLTCGWLPFYSFIMCWNDSPDTSMHPNSMVESGENLLACIYNALHESPYWPNVLLIVNFDENGGMYDHRGVPGAVAPDFDPNDGQEPPVSTWTSAMTGQTYSYDFTTLGVRIPVLLISPWLKMGVCSTQYQNTSVLRFLQGLLPGESNWLTQRDLYAPSIAPVFDYSQFGCPTIRTDCPSNVQGYTQSEIYPNLITCSQIKSGVQPTEEQLATAPAQHIIQMTRQYLGPLPGHPDSGKPLTRTFATVGEMRAYSKERMDAALAYLKAKESQ